MKANSKLQTTALTKTFLLNLLLSTFAPFSIFAEGPYTNFDDAIAALLAEHGIDESYAETPGEKSYRNTLHSEQDTGKTLNRSLGACGKKEKNCDQKCKQGYNKDRLIVLDAATQEVVNRGELVGAYNTSAIRKPCGGFKEHKFFAGVENVQTQKPFTGDTIIRLASMSKFLGTVGFLKLIDKGFITGFEPLSQFIPAFANTKVMENFTPTATVNLNNALTATNGSAVINVNEVAHGRSTGDWIGITGSSAVQGIPATEINNIHQITVVDVNNYTFAVTTLATGTSGGGEGGLITINSLAAGVQQSVLHGVTYYYVEQPLDRPILLYHVMTHELGYSYWLAPLNLSFGFAEDPTLRNTQAGIYNALQIPMGVPDPSLPLSSQTIQQWAPALAQVPLLFQPGTNWSYGPTLSILGALIEIIDGRDLETYMQQEVLQPLGMTSSGFFIQNAATDRAQKLARIMTLYFANTFIPVTAVPSLAYINDYFYGLAQPKTLALIDGGFYSTPNDYLKFLEMLINNGFTQSGQSILSPAMITWLSENHTLENSIFNIFDFSPSQLTPGKWSKWGLGVAVTTGNTLNVPLLGTTIRGIYWVGVFRTIFTADFGNKFVVSSGTNCLGVEPSNFRTRTATLAYAALQCNNPNNENSSGNNTETSTNPT